MIIGVLSLCYSPINLLDEYGRRWLFALCYVIMASNVLDLFFGSMYFDPLPRNDKEWMLKFSWVSGARYIVLYLLFIDLIEVHHQHSLYEIWNS